MAIDRPTSEVFAVISDPGRLAEFFAGLTRWIPLTEQTQGVGARFRVLMKVGSVEAGGVAQITEWDPERIIAWEGVSGVRQRGAWRLRPLTGGTEVRLELEFDVGGWVIGRLVDRLVARIVGRNLVATLRGLRRILEYEPGR